MKKIFILIIFLFHLPAFAEITYDTLNISRPPAMRFGTGDTPEALFSENKTSDKNTDEIKAKTKSAEIQAKTLDTSSDLSMKDLNVKYLSNEISYQMEADSPYLLSDLAILYDGALKRSETIRYAIYKLSNPEENKPKEGAVKKILKPIASFSSVAGTALSSNPYMAAGALIGGNLVGAVTGDDNKINYKFTKVNDADMVVLVRKIDELQKKLLFLYMDYVSSKELYKKAQDNLDKRKIMYDTMQETGSREEILVADSYFRLAQETLSKAKSKYELSRTILENLTGREALLEIEKDNNSKIKNQNPQNDDIVDKNTIETKEISPKDDEEYLTGDEVFDDDEVQKQQKKLFKKENKTKNNDTLKTNETNKSVLDTKKENAANKREENIRPQPVIKNSAEDRAEFAKDVKNLKNDYYKKFQTEAENNSFENNSSGEKFEYTEQNKQEKTSVEPDKKQTLPLNNIQSEKNSALIFDIRSIDEK